MAAGKPIVLAKSVRVLEREKMERDFPALIKPEIKSVRLFTLYLVANYNIRVITKEWGCIKGNFLI